MAVHVPFLHFVHYLTFSSMGFYELNHSLMVFLVHFQEVHPTAKLHVRRELVAVVRTHLIINGCRKQVSARNEIVCT